MKRVAVTKTIPSKGSLLQSTGHEAAIGPAAQHHRPLGQRSEGLPQVQLLKTFFFLSITSFSYDDYEK